MAQDTDAIVVAAATAAPNFALGVAIADKGSPPQTYTFGPRRTGGVEPVAPDAVWHIGSITKSFTATLVLQHVDRGLLTLDAPIGDYLSPAIEMDPSWRALTLRQLLSHTAGLPANAGIGAMRLRATDNLHQLRQTVLSGLWSKPVTPGSFAYSNVGYVLAGYVLETVSGETWETLVQTEIAAPLKLTSLGFGPPRGSGDAWGHRNFLLLKRPVDPMRIGADNPAWIGPAGTLHMSLADLAKWGQAHLAACAGDLPRFLSAEACATMQTEIAGQYGLGWVVPDGGRVWHNGSNTMWYAVLSIDPSRNQIIAAATNVMQPQRIDALVSSLREGA
ncbi:MAG: serine hydrolase domain-containing protein [Pseudomonadota bacterium]